MRSVFLRLIWQLRSDHESFSPSRFARAGYAPSLASRRSDNRLRIVTIGRCWPRVGATVPRLRTMLIYNVLVTVCLGYVRFRSESVGILLLPAIAIHAVLAILFIGVWLKHLSTRTACEIQR